MKLQTFSILCLVQLPVLSTKYACLVLCNHHACSTLALCNKHEFLHSWPITVVQTLQELAALGCTIITTIHHPSSDVLHLFQRVMLLSQGRLLYDGQVDELSQHFATLGCPVPIETNSADHVMFLMQTLTNERLADICKSSAKPFVSGESNPHWAPHALAGSLNALEGGIKREQAGMVRQFVVLGMREVKNTLRDKSSIGARIGGAVGLNLILSLIFFRVGDSTRNNYDMYLHFGGLANIAISGMFGSAMPLLQTFPSERPQFVREYSNGTYGAIAYFWSKLITEMPVSLAAATVTFLVSYWLQGLQGNFLMHVITMWLVGLAAASTALCVGCVASSAKAAIEAAPAIFVPQILFGGFFIKIAQIPGWIRWAQYLCSLKFAINLHMIIEFTAPCQSEPLEYTAAMGMGGSTGSGANLSRSEACIALLHLNEVEEDKWFVYALILLGIFIFFRVVGLLFLIRRARGFGLV